MKTRFDQIGYPLYCDAGPSEGDMRVDLTIRLYLSPQEYARYEGPESLRITIGEPVAAGGPYRPRDYYTGLRKWADANGRTYQFNTGVSYSAKLKRDYDAFLAGE